MPYKVEASRDIGGSHEGAHLPSLGLELAQLTDSGINRDGFTSILDGAPSSTAPLINNTTTTGCLGTQMYEYYSGNLQYKDYYNYLTDTDGMSEAVTAIKLTSDAQPHRHPLRQRSCRD